MNKGKLMKTLGTAVLVTVFSLSLAACSKSEEKKAEETPADPTAEEAAKPEEKPAEPVAAAEEAEKKLFIDVHELGAGKVTAADVAEAHKKDLAAQGKHNVSFEKYWVDEKEGKVYCLSEAPNKEAIIETHKEAHGLIPQQVQEVSDGEEAEMAGGKKLFIDIHKMGPGKVNAEAVAEAHKKDLAVQEKHGVNFINYWVDEGEGVIWCLSEAADADSVKKTHEEAHGLLPESIAEVSQGE